MSVVDRGRFLLHTDHFSQVGQSVRDASISVFAGSWAFPSTTSILTTSISYILSYILAEYLIDLQAGNEPDFYATFGKRPANYTQFDYFGDIGQLMNQMRNDPLPTSRNATPAQVKVKYLLASVVTQKENFTWAGLTFGSYLDSDGRPMGQENITTVTCNSLGNTCVVTVPAPSHALVFLSDGALSESESGPSTTFATTVTTGTHLTVNPQALQTLNAHSGLSLKDLGSTSKKSLSAGVGRRQLLESSLGSVGWTMLFGWAGVWMYAGGVWR
ncbi:glycoside hydrolase family 79 protein [Amanita muscaria Koide BX008]|uniref:Glycoside hydrolase family 79 protein n=1 Tax=Amanita muscaria (strain Koide BX008) TaxID=946122 RepID=A0A0C2WUL1_AMAMK|nr:glycoside hydrolase family 79 protein [Amanita muscaria Koide BX008]